MNEEYYKLLIDESYDQIRKYYSESQNPFEFFSHVSSIRDAAERKLDRIDEGFQSNLYKITDKIIDLNGGVITFVPPSEEQKQKHLAPTPPNELLENLKDYSFWRTLQENDDTMDNFLKFVKSSSIASQVTDKKDFTDTIQSLERQLETGKKTYRIYIACTLALDLTLEENLAYKPLPDLKDIDESTLSSLSGAALKRYKESNIQFGEHIDNLIDAIHRTLEGESLSELYSDNGNIDNTFLSQVHVKHEKKQKLSIYTLRNWFNNEAKRELILERLNELT